MIEQPQNPQLNIPVVGGSAFFSVKDLQKATKITAFEKVCLWFIKPKYQVDKIEGHTLKYKVFRKRIYVLAHWINPPMHYNCRCQVVPL